MSRKKKLDFKNILAVRKAAGMNQSQFWTRYGVSQSGGSRYESGRGIPRPLAILMALHHAGTITDKDLETALK